MQYCCPVCEAENHTSCPDGFHAKPASDSQSPPRPPWFPLSSPPIKSPPSSTFGGCRKYATVFPSGDTLTSLIQFSPSHKTFPTGYCNRHPPPVRSITDIWFPSGAQSTSDTFPIISRGALPPIGVVANVPNQELCAK